MQYTPELRPDGGAEIGRFISSRGTDVIKDFLKKCKLLVDTIGRGHPHIRVNPYLNANKATIYEYIQLCLC